jgi:hypothetical protein
VFRISYVGHSASVANERRQEHVGKYRTFRFEYYNLPRAAFEKERHLLHDRPIG